MEEGSILEVLKGLFKKRPKEAQQAKEELKEVLQDLKEENLLSPLEEKLILDFLKLRELKVRDLTIPRHLLKGLDEKRPWKELKEIILTHPHYFYPVYQDVLDNFTGYVCLKDLVPGLVKEEFDWKKHIYPALTLPEHISLNFALEKFIEKKVKVAFVVDELSELSGILRLKDIMKEFMIVEACPFSKDKEGWFLVSGSTKIKDLERCFGISFPEGNFETISGFIINSIQRIPSPGETLSIAPFKIKILSADKRKINSLKLRFEKEEDE
jgi:CBS domain containing-hemolysin-like protein